MLASTVSVDRACAVLPAEQETGRGDIVCMCLCVCVRSRSSTKCATPRRTMRRSGPASVATTLSSVSCPRSAEWWWGEKGEGVRRAPYHQNHTPTGTAGLP